MKAYHNAQIFSGKKMLSRKAVLTDKGSIVDVIDDWNIPENALQIDLQGKCLAPSFIDLQIYGGNGHLFGEHPSVESLEATYEYSLLGGAAYFMHTVATHSENVMFAAIEAVRTYQQKGGKGVLGLHLEGPYINPIRRGAHLLQYIQPHPTLQSVKKIIQKGQGIIKMMTLAPEIVSDEVITYLQENGIVLFAGHSNATYEQAKTAFQKGIKGATHLFNAMSPLQHRALGMVGAIYDDENVCASIVVDGIHTDFAAVRISKTILKERLFVITDAVTSSKEGLYLHQIDGNKYVIPDGTLSGSALTMRQAVQNCIEKVGINPKEALRMASLYPARVMGLEKRMGEIKKGFVDDMVILDIDLA